MYDTELHDLCCHILQMPDDTDNWFIQEKIKEKFNCCFGNFADIVECLSKLAMTCESTLGDNVYQGFADTEKRMFLYKRVMNHSTNSSSK